MGELRRAALARDSVHLLLNALSPATLHRQLEDLETRLRAADPAALPLVESLRPAFMVQRDQLLKARFLLAADQIEPICRPVAAQIEDLLRALRVFRANGLAAELARCLARLCLRYTQDGLDLAALTAGRAALDAPQLHLVDRIHLLGPMTRALTHQMRLPAAWALVEEVAASARVLSRDGVAWAHFELTRAALHGVEAIRAARLPSVYSLELGLGAADPLRVEQHLSACERLLDTPPVTHLGSARAQLRAIVAAMRGQADQALGLLRQHSVVPDSLSEIVQCSTLGWCLRVLGRPAEALASLQRADELLQRLPAGKARLLVDYDLALCLRELGRSERACDAFEHYIRQRAICFATETVAARALEEALNPRESPRELTLRSLAQRSARPPEDIELLRTEPPCLALAERALLQHLPRRLGVQALAQHGGVSLRTLQQAARRYRGQTLSDLLRQCLMKEALQLMADTDLSLQEIAARCAYRDAGAFSRDFKRVHGSAPSVHRAFLRRAAGAVSSGPAA